MKNADVCWLPSPQEIQQRAAEVRRGWDDETYLLRSGGSRKNQPMTVPVCRLPGSLVDIATESGGYQNT